MGFNLPSCSETSEALIFEDNHWRTPPTICEVCLGKATGHHYDVASCNGCKSFFRRVTTEKLKYTCKYKNDCFSNLKPGQPSPKCRACRFQKCVEVGMNPLGIHSEVRLRSSIEKPRQTIDAQVGDLIDKMIRLDVQSEKFRDCTYNPHHFPSLKESVKQDISMLSVADHYGPMSGWPLQKQTFQELCMSRAQGKKYHPSIKRWMVYELLIQIELAKALPFFSDLSESDRYYLIRDTVLMSSNLTKAFYSYEQKSDKLMRPDGVHYCVKPVPMNDQLRSCLQDDIGMRCLSAILRVGIDRVEFVLLRALVLLNPAVPEISELARKYLTKERQKYNTALFRYIMAKHGASGPTRYANILGFIEVLANQQRDHRNVNQLVHLGKQKHRNIPIFDEVMKDSNSQNHYYHVITSFCILM